MLGLGILVFQLCSNNVKLVYYLGDFWLLKRRESFVPIVVLEKRKEELGEANPHLVTLDQKKILNLVMLHLWTT
jgi:hypothetical protein